MTHCHSSEVCLFDAATQELKCKLKKHAHHVRSVSFDPSGTYLASSGGDGAVAIWDISKAVSAEMSCAFSSAKLLKDAKATPEKHLHRLAWRADGAALAVPLGNDVAVLAPGKWDEKIKLRGSKTSHTSDVCVVAW
jgi:WD40 repeat protein